MMAFKRGVDPRGLQPPILLAVIVAREVFTELEADFIVTSFCDGTHGPKSLHRFGLAMDVRTRHLMPGEIRPIVARLRDRLPGYDIVEEHDHLHIEYDP